MFVWIEINETKSIFRNLKNKLFFTINLPILKLLFPFYFFPFIQWIPFWVNSRPITYVFLWVASVNKLTSDLASSNFIFVNNLATNRLIFLKCLYTEWSFKFDSVTWRQFSESLKIDFTYHTLITFKSTVNLFFLFSFFHSIYFIFGSTTGNNATIFNVKKYHNAYAIEVRGCRGHLQPNTFNDFSSLRWWRRLQKQATINTDCKKVRDWL
jgi:hypothetical protein